VDPDPRSRECRPRSARPPTALGGWAVARPSRLSGVRR
jgi:hypothetical protein